MLVVRTDKFHWVDLVNPSRAELEELAKTYQLHPTSVQDCLDPEHLPKYQRIGSVHFLILRGYDETSVHEADTIQELTRKIAIFYTDSFFITVHRKEQPYLEQTKGRWKNIDETCTNPSQMILDDLISSVIDSYEKPIDDALNLFEKLEMGVFGAQGAHPFQIQEGYFLKRKASVYKRILRATIDIIQKVAFAYEGKPLHHQNVREDAESLYFFAEELSESVAGLLSLHISLASQKTNEASHRTNEVVRVLTIFSVFLLPLNVITGIYGMNFEHMPELKVTYAYPMVLLTMIGIITTTYFWFRRQGWLK